MVQINEVSYEFLKVVDFIDPGFLVAVSWAMPCAALSRVHSIASWRAFSCKRWSAKNNKRDSEMEVRAFMECCTTELMLLNQAIGKSAAKQ
jgi:hypothetical protein